MASAAKFNLLGFAGSLRSEAYSRAILSNVQTSALESSHFTIFDLAEIPLYNQDLDGDSKPAGVEKFKAAIGAADGLVICTPEYNYGISGVLKNAIDWASRPGYNSVLKGKPVLMIASSISMTGGVRALGQLRETMAATLSRVVAVPEIVIPDVGNKLKDGKLIDETTVRYINNGLEALRQDITALR